MDERSIRFAPITRSQAEAVVSWRYPPPYHFYNLDPALASRTVESLLRPEHRYYAVLGDASELIAFRCFGPDARVDGGDYSIDALDMGGGLQPDLTGQGLGPIVIRSAMSFARKEFQPKRFRATVASFNQRALRVCRGLGYVPFAEFERASDRRRFSILLRDA